MLRVSPLLVIFFSPVVFAAEPLTLRELRTICASEIPGEYDAESAVCRAYLSGFIDGASATDPRVAENVAREIEGEESFSERAFRTRLSSRQRDFGPTIYAEFCIGANERSDKIATYVIDEMRSTGSAPEGMARDFVYDVFRKYFPCPANPDANG